MKILLISGHGAGDSGACGCGCKEADLTRELANIVAPKLSKYCEVEVRDQSRNAFYDCQNGSFGISNEFDYVLEIHFNAFNGSAKGTEIFVTDRENSTAVEQSIMNKMSTYFVKRGGSGVKVTNFLVINTIKSKGISSALIETCFIDNVEDMKTYQANKEKIAQAIVNGIAEGFGLMSAPKEEAPKEVIHKICYRVHAKDYGWLEPVYDGDTAGTTNQGRRVEALLIDPMGHNITVQAHIQDIGYKDYGVITRDTEIGTTNRSLRLEALCINCTDARLKYRVHIAGTGWSAWTIADGKMWLGSAGMDAAIEAVEMKIV